MRPRADTLRHAPDGTGAVPCVGTRSQIEQPSRLAMACSGVSTLESQQADAEGSAGCNAGPRLAGAGPRSAEWVASAASTTCGRRRERGRYETVRHLGVLEQPRLHE